MHFTGRTLIARREAVVHLGDEAAAKGHDAHGGVLYSRDSEPSVLRHRHHALGLVACQEPHQVRVMNQKVQDGTGPCALRV